MGTCTEHLDFSTRRYAIARWSQRRKAYGIATLRAQPLQELYWGASALR
ncbi:MAG: hypothetical protein V7K18_14195 [Nostoc sp.]